MSLKKHWQELPRELRWLIALLACLFFVSVISLILFFQRAGPNTLKGTSNNAGFDA